MKAIKQLFFVILYLVFISTVAQAITIDELGKTTVYIREQFNSYEMKGGRKYEIWFKDTQTGELTPKLITKQGTGFLVVHNKHIYIVTAAHVAKDMSNKAEIIWNTASDETRIFTIEDLEKKLPYSKWFFHTFADIAVHPFGFTEKTEHILVPEELFIKKNEVASLGTKVYVLGFPLNLGLHDTLSPISKKAEIASWITTIDYPNIRLDAKFILLDEDLAVGYSGAPVFISPEPQMQGNKIVLTNSPPKLIGIQSGTIADQTGGKISLVVPIPYLDEIFSSEEFKKYKTQIGIE
ncbi:MAG: serine protease [Candidatus Saelkia tenebricola]|nr:serine protease [Candidatus Saelkia tenebricola]